MENQVTLIICGIHSLLPAIFHIFFWKIFNWKKELQRGSATTREIVQILNLRIIYVFFFTSFICFYYSEELASTPLGNTVLIGTSIFWLGRMIEQFVFWNYNSFKINTLFISYCLIGVIIHLLPIF